MTTDTSTNTIPTNQPMTTCPTCKGAPSTLFPMPCLLCGGTGWVPKIDPILEPAYQITINPVDLTLSLQLTRLEEKLDRLLAALEGTS